MNDSVYIYIFLSVSALYPYIHPFPGLGAHARYQKHTQG